MELQVGIPMETKFTRQRRRKSCPVQQVRWLHSREEGGGGTRWMVGEAQIWGWREEGEVEEEKGEAEHRSGEARVWRGGRGG